MSTGLTWVAIIDIDDNTQPNNYGMIQFSDYSEAKSYCKWLALAIANTSGLGNSNKITIWTTSPNVNGWYNTDSFSDPTFTPFD